MNLKQGLGILIATVVLVSFQNCGRGGEVKHAQTGADVEPLGVNESVSVLESASTSGQTPATRTVIPRRIQFGFLDWQYWDYAMTPADAQRPIGQVGPNRMAYFAFDLDIVTGRVIDVNYGDLLLQLSSEQRLKLRSILSGSIIASPNDLDPRRANCVATYSPPYSSLITSGGTFELGAGAAPCARDLLKRKSPYPSAGLREFLEGLELDILSIEVVGN